MKITFNGREVHNPVARALIIALMPFVLVVGIIVAIGALFVLTPIMLILHPFFRLFGRVGTFRQTGNSIKIALDGDSFRRK